MKKEYLVIGFLIAVVAYLIYTQGCTLTLRCDNKEGYDDTPICSKVSTYGADAAFVASCNAYQTACGEDSTSIVVHDINGEYGLNSDQADASMAYLVANVGTQKCCDPASPDAANCTGTQ
jgi:hypothetical protein